MKAARMASWMKAAMVMGLMAGAAMGKANVAAAEDLSNMKPVAFNTIERSPFGIWLRPFVVMATSPTEWVQVMDDVAANNELLLITQIPAPQDVDWSKEAVVVVGGGRATAVRVRDVRRAGNTAVLDVLQRTPLQLYNFNEVAPFHIVKIDRRGIKAVVAQYTTEGGLSD